MQHHPDRHLTRNFLNFISLKHHVAKLAALALISLLMTQSAIAGVLAFDMVGSADQNLTSYTNPYTGAFASGERRFPEISTWRIRLNPVFSTG